MTETKSYPPKITEEQRIKLREILQEKAIEKHKKESRAWRRVMQFATIFCISFNLLILCDLFVFPQIRQTDRISKTEVLQVKKDNYNTLQIYTDRGKFWIVENSKYDFTGHPISYSRTPFFSITYDIANHSSMYMIQRSYPARSLAILSSSLGVLASALGLLFFRLRKTKTGDHLIQLSMIITGVELLLLLF